MQGVNQNTAGAGTAPQRYEIVAKHAQTTNPISTITLNAGTAGTFDTDSNISALGSEGVEELNVQDGAVYYDKTLNKEYVLYNNAWTEV